MRRTALPGFRLTMGFTLVYLSLIVLVPLAVLALRSTEMTWSELWELATGERAIASYKVTFGCSFAAGILDVVFGTLIAWAIVRYRFWGHRVVDALVDVPFALPTAVSGLALTQLFAPTGWFGAVFAKLGIQTAYSPLGIVIALTFIGLPFVVRTVQPILEGLEPELEEAAMILGASRRQTLARVIFPVLAPAMLTGFALAFARAIGEYGSVVFISGNKVMETEVTPFIVMGRLEQFDDKGAMALALVMLVASFVLLFVINSLGAWTRRRAGTA